MVDDDTKHAIAEKLRLRFLQAIMEARDKKATVSLYEVGDVEGTVRSIDTGLKHVHLAGMDTHLGVVQEALLRGSDVMSVNFKLD
eukprot:m.117316 g.117316  ORF g.117316 m.117316 type:complete len:85 (+) comp14246_c0_seq3:187-441(+)